MQLVAENLILERGGRTVVDGLSFRLEGGEALLLTGPNGSGKTTLLRALAGFLRAGCGRDRGARAAARTASGRERHATSSATSTGSRRT